MAEAPQLRPLVAVVGPTGSGKSALAVRLAQSFHGEIVNCDSLQLYRYLDIGTAKPLAAERGGVPHHLFDLLDPDKVFTAGEYQRPARSAPPGPCSPGSPPEKPCRSSPEAPASPCAPCSKGSAPARRVAPICGRDWL